MHGGSQGSFLPGRVALTLVLAWVGAAACWAAGRGVPAVAEDYLLRRWDTDDGLPQNSIHDIAQTPDGYLWLGTRDGLVRFDGVRFNVFRSFGATNHFFPDVRCLAVGGDGSLWAGLERATVVRERQGNFELVAAPGTFTDHIFGLAADGSGDLWAGYNRAGLGHWSRGEWNSTDLNPVNKAGRFRDNVLCCADGQRRIWFATEWMAGYIEAGEPVILTSNRQEFFRLAPCRKGGVWLSGGRVLRIATTNGIGGVVADLNELGVGVGGDVQALIEDRHGAVWIGTRGRGLFRYHEGEARRVPTSHNYIRALCEDREGNLWVGTDGGGLNRLRLRNLRVYDRSNVLPKDLIVSLCEDTEGALWVVPREAAPVRLAPGRRVVVPQTNHWDMLSGTTLCADRAGGIWLGHHDLGVFHLRGDRYEPVEPMALRNKQITSILEDSRGTLWVGTLNDGLITVRDDPNGRLLGTNHLKEVTVLAEDAEGCLWVGTYAGTLHQRVRDGFVSHPGTPGPTIQTIYPDGPGRLWIGTRGGGLLRFKDGILRQATHEQGLADDDVRQILADEEGGLWIGSAHGLFQVFRKDVEAVMDGKAGRFESIVYGRNEGLGSLEFVEGFRNAACRTRDGKLWFATTRGAVEVNPEQHPFRLVPPFVRIEELHLDGQPVPLGGERPVIIPAHTRSLEVRYTGLSFASPENVRFRYRLEDVEGEWFEADTRRAASYPRLRPGKYRFHVTARGSGGVWQPEGATLELLVLPTLLQNAYFRTLLAVLLLGGGVLAIRTLLLRRIKVRVRALEQAQTLNNERRRIARDMHDELGASLTRIELMGNQILRNPRLDGETLTQVGRITSAAREVVRTLDEIVWTVNPGNDRLDRVIGYLGHYAVEFLAPTRIQFRQELPESVPPASMPSHIRHELLLAVKEALNNAVKHSGATEITLEVSLEDRVLHIRLADNGQGFDPAAQSTVGDGRDNLRERLGSIGGQCRTESAAGRGSVVSITLPLPGSPPS